MDVVSFIAVVAMFVVATTIKHYCAVGSSKTSRERSLLKRATRAAKISQSASQNCTRLSNASNEFSNAATLLFGAARQARDGGRFFQFACLYLYGKVQFYRAGWLIGRATQFRRRAEAQLREATAIMNLVERSGV